MGTNSVNHSENINMLEKFSDADSFKFYMIDGRVINYAVSDIDVMNMDDQYIYLKSVNTYHPLFDVDEARSTHQRIYITTHNVYNTHLTMYNLKHIFAIQVYLSDDSDPEDYMAYEYSGNLHYLLTDVASKKGIKEVIISGPYIGNKGTDKTDIDTLRIPLIISDIVSVDEDNQYIYILCKSPDNHYYYNIINQDCVSTIEFI